MPLLHQHRPGLSERASLAAAIALAIVCVAALGLRTQTAEDLGYHLAYGETFLESGRIVDHNPFLYTLPRPGAPPEERPPPGPGCYYDRDGRYRFPNANWLSQVLMAAAFRLAGIPGLCLLGAALVLSTCLLMLLASVRLRVPAALAAAGMLLFGLVSFSRLNLRPELFGYVALALEIVLLAGPLLKAPHAVRLPWRTVLSLVAVQVLFVNLHSYFLLGVALSGALLADILARWAWCRLSGGPPDRAAGLLRESTRPAALVIGMGIASFLNPWGSRLAILPVQTLLYLRANGIGGGAPGAHPWSHILEFRETIRSGFPSGFWGYGYLLVLVLAFAGLAGAALRRRWSFVLILAGMTLVSLSMRRNVAAGSLAMIPVSLAAIALWVEEVLRARAQRSAGPGEAARRLRLLFDALVVAGAMAFTAGIVTSRFYEREGHPTRFGVGLSRLTMPLRSAAWLDEHLPGRRAWCDLGLSSNLHFFTRPHRDTPILGNTWAFPPAVMAENRRLRLAEEPFAPVAARYGIEAVVVSWRDSLPLARELAGSGAWAVVEVEGPGLLFVRAAGETEAIARDSARLLREADPAALVERYAKDDPFLDEALIPVGQSLAAAGLHDQALAMFGAVVLRLPRDARAWQHLGRAYAARGALRRDQGDAGFSDDLAKSAECLATARRLDP